ncbi:MAG: T9SS type A sorting domain-containing protein, partial [Chlorobi bacterium]|nr:T9SS type A sorting domain-containing protein [Chlorobiota bacterium]
KNEWIYSYKYEYTYIYDKLASVLFLQRDTDNQIWNKIYKNIFFWSEFKPEKPELPDNLFLYPNPVKKILILAWKSLESGTADIFSSEGKFIRRYKIADDKSEIDVSQYPEGFYILKINTSDNKTATRKFIKIK